MQNPFAPTAITTTSTVWNLDHIYSAQSKDIHHIMTAMAPRKEEQIRGIFSAGLRWLVKLLAPALANKLADAAHDAGKKASDWANAKNRGLTRCESTEHISDDDSSLADIEKNPGPVIHHGPTVRSQNIDDDEEPPPEI